MPIDQTLDINFSVSTGLTKTLFERFLSNTAQAPSVTRSKKAVNTRKMYISLLISNAKSSGEIVMYPMPSIVYRIIGLELPIWQLKIWSERLTETKESGRYIRVNTVITFSV